MTSALLVLPLATTDAGGTSAPGRSAGGPLVGGSALAPGSEAMLVTEAFPDGAAADGPTAPDDPEVRALARAAGISDDELADLAWYADAEGVPVADAIARHGGAADLADAAAVLAEEHPDDVAWVRWDDGVGTVAFRDAAPAGASATLDDDVVVVEGAGFSAPELAAATEAVHREVRERTGLDDVSTVPDPVAGTITVSLPAAETVTGRSALLRSTASATLSLGDLGLALPAGVSVETTTHPAGSSSEALYGGQRMVTGGSLVCTSGFAARTSAYPNAMITAKHCTGSSATQAGASLTQRAISSDWGGDVKLYSTSTTTSGRIVISSSGTLRSITSATNPVVGAVTCKYGVTTGYGCSQVHATGVCRSSYCNLTNTVAWITDGGDSGAPWFYGNVAHGVHSGKQLHGLRNRSYFTPARSALSKLGASLR